MCVNGFHATGVAGLGCKVKRRDHQRILTGGIRTCCKEAINNPNVTRPAGGMQGRRAGAVDRHRVRLGRKEKVDDFTASGRAGSVQRSGTARVGAVDIGPRAKQKLRDRPVMLARLDQKVINKCPRTRVEGRRQRLAPAVVARIRFGQQQVADDKDVAKAPKLAQQIQLHLFGQIGTGHRAKKAGQGGHIS